MDMLLISELEAQISSRDMDYRSPKNYCGDRLDPWDQPELEPIYDRDAISLKDMPS